MALTNGDVQDRHSDIDAEIDGELGDDEDLDVIRTEDDVWALHRLNQDAIFDAWFTDQVQKTDMDHVPKARRSEVEPNESLKDILKKHQEDSPIIGSERAYQIELFERAKQQNTIAVLDTGTGKTLIAILLLKHVLDQEVEAQGAGKPRKIAVFLVEKVTLMLQQEAVLRANLSHKVVGLRGDSDYKLWDDEHWQKIISENDCIICTADVMLFALMRSFLKFRDIALLIFDEAHHAKGNHPYARIMKRFYPDDINRQSVAPRIFGMTASPIDVDDHDDVEEKARELETTLHSTITTTTGSELDKFISRPVESQIVYQVSYGTLETRLFQSLRAKYWDLSYFNMLFQTAQRVATAMGPWCSDMYWTFAFSEQAAKKLMQKSGHMNPTSVSKETIPEAKTATEVGEAAQAVDDEVSGLQNAAVDIQDYEIGELRLDLDHLSPKVMRLRELLLEYYERPTGSRCLVFVEERATARLLKEVFDRVGTSHMQCGYLVGSTARNVENVKHSFTEQIKTLIKFRSGEINCLFATSVAEEGLDVPGCNLVVRYDRCKTMIQYIQSRGRARHRNSKYIHLLDGSIYSNDEISLEDIRDCEERMRRYCRALPEDRRIRGADPTLEELEARDDHYPSFTNSKTGATLSFFFSLVVIHHFVDCIPRDETDDMAAIYTIYNEGRKFRCELTLPARARVPAVQGRSYGRKMEAKMSAAYEACRMLHRKELLDDFFLPTIRQELHLMRGAKLALKGKKKSGYEMLLKPALWSTDRGSMPKTLYSAKLILGGEWDRPIRQLILLTRQPLPTVPSFPVYRAQGKPVEAKVENIGGSLSVTEAMLSRLNWFTLTIFKDVYNKQFENNPSNMSYWLAPVRAGFDDESVDASAIDWCLLNEMHNKPPIEWTRTILAEEMVGRFMVDPFNGGKRYFTKAVAHGMKSSDPVPEALAGGNKRAKTILDYTCSLWLRSKQRQTWDDEQPVLQAERILHRLDVLTIPTEADRRAALDCLIVPQPIRVSRLPTDVVSMALLFPAIIHRVESYLIALEFTTSRGLTIRPALALEALTKDSDNSDEHEETKVKFQHGMGPNYERLEFLGDAFLKMATSIAIYMRNPGKDEHWMHADRMALLCNRTLMENAIASGVPKYIRSMSFSRRYWYPEGLKLEAGKGANKDPSEKHRAQLNGKSIADVCEATMGAALVEHMETGYEDPSCMDDAVRAVTEFVANKELQKHDMKCWADYYRAYDVPKWQLESCGAIDRRLAREIEKVAGYQFKHVPLLVSAFTHPSLPSAYRTVPSYQRLEFLGDSLLDVAIDWYLFKKYPGADPSWLTEHKMPMVSNKFIGALSAKLGFCRHMKHQSSTLMNQMTAYLAEYEEGVAHADGRPDFWLELRDPPKYMADLVEAYVGAMFVDSQFHYPHVQRFFDEHILPYFRDMTIYDTFANNHPVNRLRERLEVQLGCRNHRLMVRERVADDEQSSVALSALVVHNKCIGRGQASSSKVAKFHAASDAAGILEGLTPRAFRMEFGCDCVAVEEEIDGMAISGGEDVIDA